MELIRISNGKIKIALSRAELEAYSLSAQSLDIDGVTAGAVFKELLVRAKESTGFDVEEDKVFVQIYTAKDGGCEIFVTRIEPENRKKRQKAQKQTFRLETLQHLLSACKRLKSIGYRGRSDAYAFGDGYILTLYCPNVTHNACLCDFGEKTDGYTEGFVSERMKLIRKGDAVKILAEL